MLLAGLEIFHSRPAQPTRRVALGHMVLPVDPAPGFGGLLLGSVVASHLPGIDDDLGPDIHRLIDEVGGGRRVLGEGGARDERPRQEPAGESNEHPSLQG